MRGLIGAAGIAVALVLFIAAGPTLIALSEAAVPLVVALGLVVVVWRLVWFFTSGYR